MSDHLRGPISHLFFRCPYIAPDGYTYEYTCLKSALEQNASSPMTREPMTLDQCYPNRLAQESLTAYWTEHPEELIQRYPLTIEEFKAGHFDSFDQVRMSDFTGNEWLEILSEIDFDLGKFQRFPIVDYHETMKDTSEHLVTRLSWVGNLSILRWLVEEKKVPLKSSLDFLDKNGRHSLKTLEEHRYYYRDSPLISAIAGCEEEVAEYLLSQDPDLLVPEVLAESLIHWKVDDLLTFWFPLRNRLSELDWETPFRTYGQLLWKDQSEMNLKEYLLTYCPTIEAFNFFLDHQEIFLTEKGLRRVLNYQLDPDEQLINLNHRKFEKILWTIGVKIAEFKDENNQKLARILKNQRSIFLQTNGLLETYLRRGIGEIPENTGAPFEVKKKNRISFWTYRIRLPGWEEKLVEKKWIKLI